jgi:hypothetical protein
MSECQINLLTDNVAMLMLQVLMEIVAVNSAIYGVVLSMVICMVAVMLFTRHIILLLVIFISITGKFCTIFTFLLGYFPDEGHCLTESG